MLKTIGIGIILFGISATASYFLLSPKPEVVETPVVDLAEDNRPQTPGELASSAFQQPPTQPADDPASPEQMPVAIRPEPGLSMDVISQLSDSIREKEKLLKRREERVAKDEERVKMLFDDLKREQKELDSFAMTIDQKTQVARELLDKLKQERNLLLSEKQEISKLQKSTAQAATQQDTEMTQRIKKVQGWFQDMEADVAARYVKTMADSGELKNVSKVLEGMEQRKVAEILAALGDEVLAKQILEATLNGK